MEIEIESESEDKEKGYGEYDLKCAVDTIIKAEEIKADKKLMDAIKPMLDKKVSAIKNISSLAELKKVAKEKINEPEE